MSLELGLEGKVVLVTGGTRGLGLEMCQAFSGQGATVVVVSRNEDACVQVASAIEAATGCRAVGFGCHVGDWTACLALVERVYDELGRIDVLINNAGISPMYPSLSAVTEDLFDKVIAVNLKGPFRLSSLVGARMVEADGGSIINISSISAIAPTKHELPYAAAKAGLNALSIGLSTALGPKVRVNTLLLGAFLTDISKSWDLERFTARAKRTFALQRAGEPNEVVGAALYLASPVSSYTTGAVIKLDGGAIAAPA